MEKKFGVMAPSEYIYRQVHGQLPKPADPPGDVRDLEAWNKVHWHA